MEYQKQNMCFSCRGTETKYLLYKIRYAHVDKGFSPSMISSHFFIRRSIEALGWKPLCTPPPKNNIDWVREFFVEAAMQQGEIVTVRGVDVCYSAEAINDLCGLVPPKASVYNKLIRRASVRDAARILTTIE